MDRVALEAERTAEVAAGPHVSPSIPKKCSEPPKEPDFAASSTVSENECRVVAVSMQSLSVVERSSLVGKAESAICAPPALARPPLNARAALANLLKVNMCSRWV